jgi:hypothetical protein
MTASKQPTVEQLKRAVAVAEEIKSLELQLAGILSGEEAVAPAPARRAAKKVKAEKSTDAPKKRNMSPEGRARIAAAQKERWAKTKGKKKA